MKLYLLFVLGVVMLFSAIWGGGYLGHALGVSHWAHGPLSVTCFMMGFAGASMCVLAGIVFTERLK